MSLAATNEMIADRRCSTCPVRSHAICQALRGVEIDRLNSMRSPRKYRRGDVIWEEGSEADFIAIVVSGVADLDKLLPDGREHIVGLLFASDWLGQLFSERNKVTAKAVTDLELCCFPRQRFEQALGQLPSLEHEMFIRVLSELEETRNWLVTLVRKNAGQRVADFLLTLARKNDSPFCPHTDDASAIDIILPLTRGETASYLGLTIETVSRSFTKLKLAGLITMDGQRKVRILDREALTRYADPDD